MTCPWQQFGLPLADRMWCEQQLCSWIVEPANAWSSLWLVFLGIYLVLKRKLFIFSVLIFVNGIVTFLYHASMLEIWGFWDILMNNCLATSVLAIILERYSLPRWQKNGIVLIHFLLAVSIITFGPDNSGIVFLMVTALVLAILELRQLKNLGDNWCQTPIIIFIVVALSALVVWALEVGRVYCVAANHWFQFHALWHVFMAIALYFLYRHFVFSLKSVKLKKI